MDDEAIRLLARKAFPKLLQSPVGRRVCCDIAIQNASRSKLQNHKNIKQLEPSRHRNHEIARDNCIGMVSHKCCPVLRRGSPPRTVIPLPRPVLADGSGRQENAQLQPKLGSYAHLAPSRILPPHPCNQFANLTPQRRPAWTRLPAPEQLETLSMPADQGIRLYDHESIFPVTQPGPQHQRQASNIGQRIGLHLVFLIESKLFSEK